MEIKYLKSAVTLFVPCPMVGLSNEVLKILVPHGATELPEVKIGDVKKKIRDLTPSRSCVALIRPSGRIYLRSPTLTFGSFAIS